MTCKWCLINGNFISLYNSWLCHSIHLLWMDRLICLMCLSIIAGFLLVHDISTISHSSIHAANVFSHSPINNVNLLISGFSTSVYKCKLNSSELSYNKQYCVVKFNGSWTWNKLDFTVPRLNIDNCTETFFKGSSNKLQSRYSHKATNR